LPRHANGREPRRRALRAAVVHQHVCEVVRLTLAMTGLTAWRTKGRIQRQPPPRRPGRGGTGVVTGGSGSTIDS
jgi:hypothetical protein